ncbi:MAG: zinc permease [Actinobacteria bacterium]|nr:zinc permease [Actinomycetota bacterium]
MLEALVFGIIASSALLIGSVIGVTIRIPERVLALLLAFASGALMSALAFELFEDAHEKSGAWVAGIAFVAGAAVFVAIDAWLDRRVASATGTDATSARDAAALDPDERGRGAAGAKQGAGFALLAAVTLDGVPENAALGVTLGGDDASFALLLAIFASNFPESLVGAAAMHRGGRTRRFAILIWVIAGVLLAAAVVAGQAFIPQAEPDAVSIPLAFAAGAVIASLADTLMPEAYEGGGSTVAFATAAGFLTSFVIATL